MPRRKPVKPVKPSCDKCGEDLEGPCPACNKLFCAECDPLGGYCNGCEKLFCGCYAGRMQMVSWDRHLMDDCEECESCRVLPSEMDRLAAKRDDDERAALPFFANQKALVDSLLSCTSLAAFFTLPTCATARAVKLAFLSARMHARESRHPQRHAAVLLLQRLKRKAMELASPPDRPWNHRDELIKAENDDVDIADGYCDWLDASTGREDLDDEDGYDWAGAWAAAATMLVSEDVAEAAATADAHPVLVRTFLLRAAAAAAGPSAVGAEPVGAADRPSVGQKRSHDV